MKSDSNNIKGFQIGIASSIAKPFGYSWSRTLEAASRLNLSLVQFYIPEDRQELLNQLSSVKSAKTGGFEIYFHLPNVSDMEFLLNSLQLINEYFPDKLYIIHERLFDPKLIGFLAPLKLQIAIENDSATSDILYYHKLLGQLNGSGINFTAVFDYSRFYIQFASGNKVNEIENQAMEIIRFCQRTKTTLLFHVIDHSDQNAMRENWTVLFDGLLSWKDLISYALKETDVLKSLIFEYEDYDQTEKSIERLKSWIKTSELRNIRIIP